MSLALVACGAAPSPPSAVPPSSWRDPPPSLPPPDPAAVAGDAPVGVISLGGSEGARSLVVALLGSILADDAEGAERTLAERVESAAPRRAGAPHAAVDRETLVRHWLTLARSSHAAAGTTVDDLLEPAGMTVEPAALHYAGDERPTAIEPSDLVVRFVVNDAGRRTFAGIAPGGVGVVVVRPGPEPRIVAR